MLTIMRLLGRNVNSPIMGLSDNGLLGGVNVGSSAWAAHPGDAIGGREIFLMKTRSKVATFPQKSRIEDFFEIT